MMTVFLTRWPALLAAAVVGYLLGSINWAIIVTRAFANKDIRDEGSGNAGATNVLRAHGRKAAAFTALGDVLKSVLAALCGGWLALYIPLDGAAVDTDVLHLMGGYIGGFSCIIGHVFPVFYGFRGGKGVLTTLGMFLVLDWRVALLCLGIFIVIVACCRMVSLGSVLAIGCGTPLTFFFGLVADKTPLEQVIFCAIFALLVEVVIVWKHKDNLKRIAAGTERRLGEKTEDKA